MEVCGQLYDPAALPPGNKTGTHWTGSLVNPRPGSDTVAKSGIPTPTENRTPVVQPVA